VLGGLGPTDPLNKKQLSRRYNRDKIREQISDYVLLMLGAPVVRIELDQQQLDLCANQALKIFEEWAPQSYFSYYYFNTAAGQSRYTLPDDIGIIREVKWRQEPCFGGNCLYQEMEGVVPLSSWMGPDYYDGAIGEFGGYSGWTAGPIWGRAGEWLLFKQYDEMFARMWGQIGGWEYCSEGAPTTIILYPAPQGQHWVIVHYLQKQKDWTEVHQFMQEYALSLAKIILGRVRSKYSNIPAPGGGVQLDGQALLQEGIEEKRRYEEELLTKWSEPCSVITG